jgi:hypothetical protein
MGGEMTYEFHLSTDKKFKRYIYIYIYTHTHTHTHTHIYYYEKMLTSFGTLANITPSISCT